MEHVSARVFVVAGVMVAASVAVGFGAAAVGGQVGEENDDRVATAQAALEAEIDAMLDAGMEARDQKVRMMKEELDAFEELEDARRVPEKGVDLEEVAEGGQRKVELDAPDPAEEWEDGPVECEPIPQRLSAEAIADATCFVEPRPQGGARYVAITPEGTRHEVIFQP